MIHDIIASRTLLLEPAPSNPSGQTSLDVDLSLEDIFARDEAGEVLVVVVGGKVSEFCGEDHSWLHVVVILRHGAISIDLYFADAHFEIFLDRPNLMLR